MITDLKDTTIGIEFGSTRIKAVLVGRDREVLAGGTADWENRWENGIWTYSEDDIIGGLQKCFASLKKDVREKLGITLTETGAVGISAMMHGYMPFDRNGNLLVPFRTWRNNNAEKAAEALTELFSFHIPARWSIAHLYQAILDGEEHVKDIDYITTLEGYIHGRLTGEKVIGIGEASGMFPVDKTSGTYDRKMMDAFSALPEVGKYPWDTEKILPRVLRAGENAGYLTEEGAHLLDPDGDLKAGIPFCPPEGDAGTGLVSTNCVAPGTGSVSAGTSIFAMIVLKKPLKTVHPEIDIVTTPEGDGVAMIHCNNCASEIDAWAEVFSEFARLTGTEIPQGELYRLLFEESLKGREDCGGVITYNYLSGENITGITNGRPMTVRTTGSTLSLQNLMRSNLYASLTTLKIGYDILEEREDVRCDKIYAQGGFFKTEGIYQKYLAAALNTPVTVTDTASEGGAWGMALLAAYMLSGRTSLQEFLRDDVFANTEETTVSPDAKTVKGFREYTDRFKKGLAAEKAASENMEDRC